MREIYKIDNGTYHKNLERYIPMLGLEEVINKPVRQMSLGQRVKSDICAALLHDPKILFLESQRLVLMLFQRNISMTLFRKSIVRKVLQFYLLLMIWEI